MSTSTQQATRQLSNIDKSQAEILDFLSDLQKGDFGLTNLILYGYILYGQTRAGKTATGHLLSGSALKGCKNKGQDMVQAIISKNIRASIGNGMNSQTRVPNFFEIKLPTNSKVQGKGYIIDTPGYGDTYGVLRILGNGYYHYRLYCKVQNMKFILCFDQIHIKNTGFQFIDTIVQFTSSFKDYHQNRHKIWQSCVFLFTKVEQAADAMADLKQKLLNVIAQLSTQLQEQQQNDLKQFIKFILQQNRIFIIKKYKKGESASRTDLLEKIQEKIPVWWHRDLNKFKPNEVDMTPIMFSMSKQIDIATTKQPKAKRQFIQLIEYYNKRIKQFVQDVGSLSQSQSSLAYVINQLVKDAMGQPDSHQFLNVMNKYIQIYYKNYDKNYQQQRQIRQKQLFNYEAGSTVETIVSTKGKKFNDKNYICKKFKTLKRIEELKIQLNQKELEERNTDLLEECQTNVYQIIRQFNTVSFKRNMSTQIIYKYGYIIHRIIQEAKVFVFLMQSSSKQNSKKILDAANGNYIDLFRPLKDFMGLGFNYDNQTDLNYENLHTEYVKKFDPDHKSFEKVILNQTLIDFINEIPVAENEQIEKILKLIVRYSDQVLLLNDGRFDLKMDQIQRLIQRLVKARYNCIELHKIEGDQDAKRQHLLTIRKITCNIGQLLQLQQKYDLARRVYDSIKFVDSICELYDIQIKELKAIKDVKKKQIIFRLKIEYAKYLANHSRQKQAILTLQGAFELASNSAQIMQAKKPLSELLQNSNDKVDSLKYQQFLFDEVFFEQFSSDFEKELCFGKTAKQQL